MKNYKENSYKTLLLVYQFFKKQKEARYILIIILVYLIFVLLANRHHQDSDKLKQQTELSGYTNAELKKEITKTAKSLIGAKYKSGGSTPKGFDCSGFVWYVFKKYNVILPKGSKNQIKIGREIELADADQGDLIFFKKSKKRNKIDHVAICIDNERFIHASSQGIVIDEIGNENWKNYWGVRFYSVKRVLE